MKLIYIVQVSSPNLINHGDALDCGAAMVPLRRIIILNMTNDANDINNRSLKTPDFPRSGIQGICTAVGRQSIPVCTCHKVGVEIVCVVPGLQYATSAR